MSYRIHLGIIQKKDLDKHTSKQFSDSDEDYDKKMDFFTHYRDIELFDETPIKQFEKLKGYENEEYPPYVLSKNDLQKILDFYKKFLKESFKNKQKILDKKNIKPIHISDLKGHFHYLKCYFDGLIKQKKNISDCGLFLIDYFYLVMIYEKWTEGDVALISHG